MRAIDETDNTVDAVTESTEGAESEPAQATGEVPEEGQRAPAEFGAHVREVTQRIVDLMGPPARGTGGAGGPTRGGDRSGGAGRAHHHRKARADAGGAAAGSQLDRE